MTDKELLKEAEKALMAMWNHFGDDEIADGGKLRLFHPSCVKALQLCRGTLQKIKEHAKEKDSS